MTSAHTVVKIARFSLAFVSIILLGSLGICYVIKVILGLDYKYRFHFFRHFIPVG